MTTHSLLTPSARLRLAGRRILSALPAPSHVVLSVGAVLLASAAGVASAQTQNLVFITNENVGNVVTPGQAGTIGDGSDSASTRKVLVFDIDDDGFEDVFFLNHGASSRGLMGDGTGVFVADGFPGDDIYSASASKGAKGIAIGDADGDGDMDAILASGPVGGVHQANVWLANVSVNATNYIDVSGFQPPHVDHSYDASFLTLAGDMAVVVANRLGTGVTGQNRLYIDSDANGVYETVAPAAGEFASDAPAEIWSSRALVVADLDGDGLDDVVVANAGNGGHPNQAFLQSGGALVAESVAGFASVAGNSYGVSLADLDADGLLDLLVANRQTAIVGELNQLFRNASTLGDLEFVAETLTVVDDASAPSYDVTFGDLDGDGDSDLIVANNDADNAVYMNNTVEDGVSAFSAGGFTEIVDGLLQSNAGRTRSAVIAEFADYGPDGNHQGAEVVLANSIAGSNEFYRGMGKQFVDLGGATNGDINPNLRGNGFFSPTSGGALLITGGQTNASQSLLFMDVTPAAIPFGGGTLVVDPSSGTAFVSSKFQLGNDGSLELAIDEGDIPASMSGMQLFSQVLTRDEGLPTKRGLTNGLSIVIQ